MGARRPLNNLLGRAAVYASVFALLSGLAFAAVDGWKRVTTMNRLENELASVRQAALVNSRNANAIREQLESIAAVRAAKQDRPSLIEIWNEVSRVVPAGSWGEEIRLRGDTVSLAGYSGSASSLIRALSGSPIFEAVEFSSPVSRDPATGLERFEIRLRLKQQGEKQASGDPGTGGRDGS